MTSALEFSHVTFSYPHAQAPVLRDVSLVLEQGSFCLLTGPTGAGKSTLMRLAKPELSPLGKLSGDVRVMGVQANGLSTADSATLVGMVQQDPSAQLVSDSVWHELAFALENVGTSQNVIRLRIAQICHFFGIEPWFRRRVTELSGGEQQLLALASALVLRPRVLLLDEPCAMLDPVAERNIAHALFRINRELGVTVLVATHTPAALEPYATVRYVLEAPDAGAQGGSSQCHLQPSNNNPGDAGRHGAGRMVPPAKQSVPNAVVSDRLAPALALSDVWWRYERDGAWVLRGCSLRVETGSVHALCGGNGSGKSTLLALASGVRKPARGRVKMSAEIKGSVALLPQDPIALFACDTVAEELVEFAAGGKEAETVGQGHDSPRRMALAAELAAQVGLACDDETLARSPYDLSGGERQLLALAKLLACRPRLLLLDEPGKGLDDLAKQRLVSALRVAHGAGVTIVLSTHDLALVEALADEVTLLFDGQAAASLPADAYLSEMAWV